MKLFPLVSTLLLLLLVVAGSLGTNHHSLYQGKINDIGEISLQSTAVIPQLFATEKAETRRDGGASVLANTEQVPGSLYQQHQEAKDVSTLLESLIKRLTEQVKQDTDSVNLKIEQRLKDIAPFEKAVADARSVIDQLDLDKAALGRKIEEAKTALAQRTGERNAEMKIIEAENAEQRARLAERIAVVERQIAMIQQIREMLHEDLTSPIKDSTLLSSAQQRALVALFKGTSWENKKFRKVFLASENGYRSSAYLEKVRGLSPLVTVVKSSNGNLFGGFTAVAPDGSGFKTDDTGSSFLFTLSRNGKESVVKMPNDTKNKIYTLYSSSSVGPVFGGGHDLQIADKCNENVNSYSNLGYSYSLAGYQYGTTEIKTYLGGYPNFACADYEVFMLYG